MSVEDVCYSVAVPDDDILLDIFSVDFNDT